MERGSFETRIRKRKSRWANDEAEKLFIPGMPTTLPADATEDQKEQYLLQLQIEEATRRLRSGDLGIPAKPEDRSPSPEPIYNSEGKRMNTREYRTRKTLEEQRHERIQRLFKLNDNYKPPADYKPPAIRVNDKVTIPQDNHPEINFVGLLIGPRGNTLKNLEKETGAKIIIRGKGSVKEGKIGRKDGQPMPGEDEPLHAYVTANDPACVTAAVKKIHDIIKEGIEIPEENNDLRKQQLRELALLNGTLRDNDGIQKLRQIAEAQTIVTNTIICTKCGGAGHISGDCTFRAPADLALVASRRGEIDVADAGAGRQDRAKMDSEYMSLMAELGQVAPGTVRDQLQAQMPRQHAPVPLMDIEAKPARPEAQNTSESSGGNPPAVSSDYGYGGKRSRFENFQSNTHGGFGSPSPNRNPGSSGFNNSNSNRFNNGGPSSYNDNSNNRGGFNNGPPPNNSNNWGGPMPPGPPPSNRWGSPLPPPPGPPSFNSGPPPPSAPPKSGGFGNPPAPPPGPPTGYGTPASASSHRPSSHPWQTPPAPRGNAPPPWQSGGNPPPPPWQSSFGNPGAPPPPPPSSTGFNKSSYGGYGQPPLPPPPPPQ